MYRIKTLSIPTLLLLFVMLTCPALAAPSVSISVDRAEIGMGQSVVLTSRVSTGSAHDRGGYRIIPFVNGARWGAIETTTDEGIATHLLPLPNAGPMTIQVLAEAPPTRAPQPSWIWGDTRLEKTTQYFQQRFQFQGDPALARLFIAVDDEATVYLNGEEVGTVTGWKREAPLSDLATFLVDGENVISIAATSNGGLAGLLVRLDTGPDLESPVLISDSRWTYFPSAPYVWPFYAEVDGLGVHSLGDVHWNPYRRSMGDWPGLTSLTWDMVGTPAPTTGLLSAPTTVNVVRRALKRPPVDPAHRVGIQFEPWFTPGNANWSSAHAIPLTGRYWSWNRDAIRQQLIWLMESGIDFLVVDWTNHLWGKAHWNERSDNTNEIIHATTMLLESLATMRDEGLPVPQVVLYTGLNNGPSTTIEALNEEMEWIRHNYIRNPRFSGLFEIYKEKPLLLVHNGGGPQWHDESGAFKPDNTYFTVRNQSFQHELNDHADYGFWSWMDASLEPVPTPYEGGIEALTVSTAFFGVGGWKKDGAHGRRGGATFLDSFRAALTHRPQFLQIHQYQEFAGQWEGYGYGPHGDLYVDSYNVELSDDIEPVSRTAAAYRGQGGWGFYYLNLLRALVDLYHQAEPETTVLVMSQPSDGDTVVGEELDISWTWLGKAPSGITLRVNDQLIETDPMVPHHTLDLSAYPTGPLRIAVTAGETQSRYPLSFTEASAPQENMGPATIEIVCQHRQE